jgi:UDP-N-acetylmuramate dehydrogenase
LKNRDDIIAGTVRRNEPLSMHTTFRIGGPADLFLEPENRDDFERAIEYLDKKSIPFFLLGRGSNVLACDRGTRKAVVSTLGMREVDTQKKKKLYAEAGAPLMGVIKKAAERSLSGLEFAAGIPGSVGGGVMMNAGAHGYSLGDVIEELTIYTPARKIVKRKNDTLYFEYRRCGLGEGEIVIGAWFKLAIRSADLIEKDIVENLRWRKEKQPLGYPSAGSVFKNPAGESAGKIIDEVGLKGTTVGRAQVSPVHANFIVNLGGARAQDVLELIDLIRDRVKKERGIDLDLEIRIITEDS